MHFTIPLLWAKLDVELRLLRRPPTPSPSPSEPRASQDLLGPAWSELILRWDVPPEALRGMMDRDLGAVLRSALAGAAAECAAGRPNPFDGLTERRTGGHSRWDAVALRVSSPKALSPPDPFHGARALAKLGGFDACIDPSGRFSFWTHAALERMDPALLAEAASALGSRMAGIEPAAPGCPAPVRRRPRHAPAAVSAATPPVWTDLVLLWDVAPEALAPLGAPDLAPVLRAAARGAALAILSGDPNPLEEIPWRAQSPGLLGTSWDALARRVSSPRALSSDDPFHEARELARVGAFGSCSIGDDGQFSIRYSDALRRMDPQALVRSASRIASAAERAMLEDASRRAPSSGPRRL